MLRFVNILVVTFFVGSYVCAVYMLGKGELARGEEVLHQPNKDRRT